MRGSPKGWIGLLEAFQLTSIFPANAFETKYWFARLENATLQLGADISGLNLPSYTEMKCKLIDMNNETMKLHE